MWDTILLIFLVGCFILVAYTLGLKNGQKLKNNEEIKMPEVNPVRLLKNEMENYEEKKKQEINEINMFNIDNYDGTGLGQRDIPR